MWSHMLMLCVCSVIHVITQNHPITTHESINNYVYQAHPHICPRNGKSSLCCTMSRPLIWTSIKCIQLLQDWNNYMHLMKGPHNVSGQNIVQQSGDLPFLGQVVWGVFDKCNCSVITARLSNNSIWMLALQGTKVVQMYHPLLVVLSFFYGSWLAMLSASYICTCMQSH